MLPNNPPHSGLETNNPSLHQTQGDSNRNKRALSVANVAIGTVGGSYALIDAVTQSDSNPYCRVSGIWFPVTVASIILTVAVLVNSRILRSPSPA